MNDILSGFMQGLTVEEYLFGSNMNRITQLSRLISQLHLAGFGASNLLDLNATREALPAFEGHPRRLLYLDEILAIQRGELTVENVLQISVEDLRGEVDFADRPRIYRKLGHCLLKRFWRFGELDDLEEGIWYLQAAIPLSDKNDYRYLEVLLGLCTGLWERLQTLGQKDDHQKLVAYLREQQLVDLKTILHPCELLLNSPTTREGECPSMWDELSD